LQTTPCADGTDTAGRPIEVSDVERDSWFLPTTAYEIWRIAAFPEKFKQRIYGPRRRGEEELPADVSVYSFAAAWRAFIDRVNVCFSLSLIDRRVLIRDAPSYRE